MKYLLVFLLIFILAACASPEENVCKVLRDGGYLKVTSIQSVIVLRNGEYLETQIRFASVYSNRDVMVLREINMEALQEKCK